MRNALFALLLASFGLTGCVRWQRLDQAPQRTKLSAGPVELPATFIRGRPHVDLKINGQGPFRFLVDTGAAATSITPQVARAAGIVPSRKHTANVMGASGQFENQLMGIVDRMESPGFTLSVVAVTILTPESVALLNHQADKSDGGILGMSALRNVLLEIDFPQSKVRVARHGSDTLAPASGIAYTGITPHITITTPNAKYATASALIDTGADGGIELADLASYPVRVGVTKADEYTFGIGGYWRPLFGQLAGDISLGTAFWRDPEIRSAIKNRIGSSALAPWKIVIDQKRAMLWLLDENLMAVATWSGPLEPDGRPAVYGFAFLPEGDSFVAKEVDPGSRAERAGLRVGDRLSSKNAAAIAVKQNHSPVAGALRLRVARGSTELEITMSLSDPLPRNFESTAPATGP